MTYTEEQLKEKLRRYHYECEDPWYNCPRSEEGCANEAIGTGCTCGADKFNALLDELFTGKKLVDKDAVVLTQEQYAALQHALDEDEDTPIEEWRLMTAIAQPQPKCKCKLNAAIADYPLCGKPFVESERYQGFCGNQLGDETFCTHLQACHADGGGQ